MEYASPTRLTLEQKASFERDGFLLLPDVLPTELVGRLMAASERLYAEGVVVKGLSARRHWDMRNCLGADPVFLEVLDNPDVLPIVAGLLDWDLHMITSHLIVRPPALEGTDRFFKGEGWHRDGGQSSRQMTEPHPRLFLKVAYFLSDQSEPGRGNTMVVPGSNRLIGSPAQHPDEPHPYGALEICGKPGDAFLFEQRTWHAVGPNYSDITRQTLFIGYGFRWIRAMDYLTPDENLIQRCENPVQRQLLGEVKSPMGVYLPTEEDVPLRALYREWYGQS